jgi:hypothetical protein
MLLPGNLDPHLAAVNLAIDLADFQALFLFESFGPFREIFPNLFPVDRPRDRAV